MVLERHYKNDAKRDDSTEKMQTMKTGQNIEEATLLGGRQVNASIHELPPRCELPRQKPETQHASDDEPSSHAFDIIAPNGSF